jgi:hypothetical protein
MKYMSQIFDTLFSKAGTTAKQLQRNPHGAHMLVVMMNRVLFGVGMIGFFALAMRVAGML